ncbi:NAD(P)H-quinone oxidoreductase [Agrococcus beijingensis]|uniref:NAD(P)H-quinone oxidoreductase n=1 Tax=Agrococcus beijingensis TaxID=3068634 RepID=UPI00274208E0|nr:NAD(P)H-quinone oxidoreductase [Agrococcus sp. REN33]
MQAIQQHDVGGELFWADAPDPVAGHGEVVIDIVASAVNRADVMQAAGKYPPPPGASPVIGLECSGTISEVGAGVDGWAVGDRVCALLAGGGYAEQVAVPATQLLPVPDGVSLEDAAALPEALCTVWSAVRDMPDPSPGAMAIVHGGSGGIGTVAIQLLRAHGYRVAATSSARHLELVRSLGAELAIDYRSDDFVDAVLTATDGRGAECILDVVGGDYLARNLAALALDSALTVIAVQGGAKTEIDLRTMMTKRVTLRAMTLRARPVTGRGGKDAVVAEVRERWWPLVGQGVVQPVIGARLPMIEAQRAHALMGSSESPGGKILLVR